MCQITFPSYENGATFVETMETIDAIESFTHIYNFSFIVCGPINAVFSAYIGD